MLLSAKQRQGSQCAGPIYNFRCSPRSVTNVTVKFSNSCRVACVGLALCLSGAAQSAPAPSADSASFDADGTAHVTRVVPMPSTISPDAQDWLASLAKKKSQPQTLAELRIATDAWRKWGSAEARRLYPGNVEETS